VIAGNTRGGLSGRLVAGFVGELGGWRAGLAAAGALSLAFTVAFRVLLPRPSRPRRSNRPRPSAGTWPTRPCAACTAWAAYDLGGWTALVGYVAAPLLAALALALHLGRVPAVT
jgi:predicted MFS family arabinose efflux permease